jgi:hypothetical protein
MLKKGAATQKSARMVLGKGINILSDKVVPELLLCFQADALIALGLDQGQTAHIYITWNWKPTFISRAELKWNSHKDWSTHTWPKLEWESLADYSTFRGQELE